MPPTVDQTSPAFYDPTSERAPNPTQVRQEFQPEPGDSLTRLPDLANLIASIDDPTAQFTPPAPRIQSGDAEERSAFVATIAAPTVAQTSPAFDDGTAQAPAPPFGIRIDGQAEAGIGTGWSPAGSGNRLTQLPVEIAATGNPKARLTQVAIEIASLNVIALQLLAFDDDAGQQFKTPGYSLPSTGANMDEGVEAPLQQVYEVVFTST